MPRIQEVRHPGENFLLYWLGNLTALDSDWVLSLAFVWFYKENGRWRLTPRRVDTRSLFYNGVFFIRYTAILEILAIQFILATTFHVYWVFLFGLFFSIRWSASTTKKAIFQTGLGYKLNGRLGLLFRIQSDKTSAAGVTGPNVGQSTGFNFGPH